MDEHEQLIWETIKTEHTSKTDREINQEMKLLQARVDNLTHANEILRSANKTLLSKMS